MRDRLAVDLDEGDDSLAILDGGDLAKRLFIDNVEIGGAIEFFGGAGSGEYGFNGGVGTDRFVEQMKAFGNGEAVICATAVLDGFADAL